MERSGRSWVPAPGDPDEIDRIIQPVAASEVSWADFRDWIAARCG